MEIDNIIQGLKVACDGNQLKPSDDMVLDCATRIWSTKFINASKNGKGDAATEKQIATMKKLFIEFKDGISKKDASDLIRKKVDSFKD